MNHVLSLPTHIMTTNLLARFLDWQDVRSFVVQSKEANELKAGLSQVVIAHLGALAKALNPEKFEKQIEGLRSTVKKLNKFSVTCYYDLEKITAHAAKILQTLPPAELEKLEKSPCFLPVTQAAAVIREYNEGGLRGRVWERSGESKKEQAISKLYQLKMWHTAYKFEGDPMRLLDEISLTKDYEVARYVFYLPGFHHLEGGKIYSFEEADQKLKETQKEIEPLILNKDFETAFQKIKNLASSSFGWAQSLANQHNKQFVRKFIERWANHYLSLIDFNQAKDALRAFETCNKCDEHLERKITTAEISYLLSQNDLNGAKLLCSLSEYSIDGHSIMKIADAIIEKKGIDECKSWAKILQENRSSYHGYVVTSILGHYFQKGDYNEIRKLINSSNLDGPFFVEMVVSKFIDSKEIDKAFSYLKLLTSFRNYDWRDSIQCALQPLLNNGEYNKAKAKVEEVLPQNSELKTDLLKYIREIQALEKKIPSVDKLILDK